MEDKLGAISPCASIVIVSERKKMKKDYIFYIKNDIRLIILTGEKILS